MTAKKDQPVNDDDGQTKGPGRPRKELPEIGDNMKGLIPDIEAAFADVDAMDGDREVINQNIQAIREDLYAKGIPKEAFDLARRYKEWPEDKRRNFDLAFAVCREAIGMPRQSDFLEKLA